MPLLKPFWYSRILSFVLLGLHPWNACLLAERENDFLSDFFEMHFTIGDQLYESDASIPETPPAEEAPVNNNSEEERNENENKANRSLYGWPDYRNCSGDHHQSKADLNVLPGAFCAIVKPPPEQI